MNNKGGKFFPGLLASFHYAINGIFYAFAKERNMKIHGCIMVLVIILGFYLQIQTTEWLFLIITSGLVIALELINTSIEALVDLVTEEYRHFAAVAKNVAAGAVLFSAFIAIIMGLIIFLPYLIHIFRG
ncbi:MAG: diacylglycerol kinase family protein [Clostridiales bacterium]